MRHIKVFKSKSGRSPLRFKKLKGRKRVAIFCRHIRAALRAVVRASMNASHTGISTLAAIFEKEPRFIDVFLNVIYHALCWDLPTDLNKISHTQRTVVFAFALLQKGITMRVTNKQSLDSVTSSTFVSIHRRFTQPEFWKRMEAWLCHLLTQALHLSHLHRSSKGQHIDWISVMLQLDTINTIFDVLFEETLSNAIIVPVTFGQVFLTASIPALSLSSTSLVPLLTRLWTTPLSFQAPPSAAPHFLRETIASLRMHLFRQLLRVQPSGLPWLPDSVQEKNTDERLQVLRTMTTQVSSVIGGGRLGFVEHCLNRILRLEAAILAKSTQDPINEIRGILNLMVFASEADFEIERSFLAVDAVSVVLGLLDTIIFTFTKKPSSTVSRCIFWALQYVLQSFNGGPTVICKALKGDLMPLILGTQPHLEFFGGKIEEVISDILVGIELHLWCYSVLRRTKIVFDELDNGVEEKKRPETGYDGEWYELEELVTIRHMVQDDFIGSITQDNPCYNPSCQRHTKLSKPRKMRLKTCAGCLRFKVCSEECQKMTWEDHKQVCKSSRKNRKVNLFPLQAPAPTLKELKFYRFAMKSFTSSFRARILLAAKVYRKKTDDTTKLAVKLDYTKLPATISVEPEENFTDVENYAECRRRTDGRTSMTVCGVFQHGRDTIRVLESCSMKPML